MKADRWSRRSFLSPQGLESATGGLPSLLLGWNALAAPLTPQSRKHLCLSRRAMACDFSLFLPAGQPRPVEAGCAALDEVERLEAKLTVYRSDSDISLINQHASESAVRVDHEVFALLETARRFSEATGGAFDAAAGTLTKVWGFFSGGRRVPGEQELKAALESSGIAQVELDAGRCSVRFLRPGIEINLGAIGKGYALDRALRLIRSEHGVRAALMQGGQSSLRALGAPPDEPEGWKIAVGDPYNPKRPPIATVRLRNRAMGTSGTAFQYFVANGRRYGHVLDPRSGWPAEEVASATVLAPTAAEADALSTAFFVAGADFARRYCREHREISAILVTRPEQAAAGPVQRAERALASHQPGPRPGSEGGRPEVMAIGFQPGEVEFKVQGTGAA